MIRISKQQERRSKCPKRPSPPSIKTGAKKDALPEGFKIHKNGIQNTQLAFIPKNIG